MLAVLEKVTTYCNQSYPISISFFEMDTFVNSYQLDNREQRQSLTSSIGIRLNFPQKNVDLKQLTVQSKGSMLPCLALSQICVLMSRNANESNALCLPCLHLERCDASCHTLTWNKQTNFLSDKAIRFFEDNTCFSKLSALETYLERNVSEDFVQILFFGLLNCPVELFF
ncbi:hypothetical protein RFI_29299 [Reticulomyxa filosa]|uniref:Uncharacterized protein n=1 Tax=Reticulomyxa filosa TaxID=46433 RepID=X6M1Q3_RETFI|nr:hypothetical protein RFI_29299 [Reticulomyxa filosa]|eukprot:ETO08093.1 hypothetical protein RFI_29299 [Reticulomyxa filosa]